MINVVYYGIHTKQPHPSLRLYHLVVFSTAVLIDLASASAKSAFLRVTLAIVSPICKSYILVIRKGAVGLGSHIHELARLDVERLEVSVSLTSAFGADHHIKFFRTAGTAIGVVPRTYRTAHITSSLFFHSTFSPTANISAAVKQWALL